MEAFRQVLHSVFTNHWMADAPMLSADADHSFELHT